MAEPHGRSGSAAPIRRDSDGLWYALFAMQARENARLVSEQPQNSIFNFFFWSKWPSFTRQPTFPEEKVKDAHLRPGECLGRACLYYRPSVACGLHPIGERRI